MSSNQPVILCATDLSPAAGAASGVAAKLALRRAEKLRLVHVSDARTATALALVRKRLEGEAQRLRRTGVGVDALLLKGRRASAVLLEHLRDEPPAMVVVSSHAKGPIDRWALGSFSESIAESSPVPTLVVRHPEAFDEWDWNKDRLAVLLALDRHSTSDVVLRWVKEFRRAGPCEVVACHINRRMPTVEEASVAPGRPSNPPELQSRLERELHKKVRDQIGDDASTVIVRPFFGEPAPCIVEIAAEIKAQLIAVGTHQRQGLARLAQFSVSRELLREAGMNVICVPVTARFDPSEAHIPDFRRVLVATDFSDLGNAAIPYAFAACGVGGLVKLVHVAGSRSGRSMGASETEALRRQLMALIPKETGDRGQPPVAEVLKNRDVAGAICAEAESFGADLVCLTSHGLGASRALHGSVTKAVLKQIRRPMLVVRQADE